MKKIYICLLSLAALLLPLTAFAQLEEFEHKSISIASQATTDLVANDQWYLVRTHWQYEADGYIYDYGEGYAIPISNGLEVVYDGMRATQAAKYLVRFLSIEASAGDLHDKYYLQFGTGNYFMYYPDYYYGYGYYFAMSSLGNATQFYVYLAQNTPYYYTISTVDGDVRMDSFGPDNYIIGGDSGETDDLSYLDDIWFLTPVTLADLDSRDEAMMNLEDAYSDYVGYRDSFTPGTDAGCYGVDEVAAFQAALDAAAQVLDDPDALEVITEEELDAMADAIVSAYEAVLASYVALAVDVAEGYYWFACGLEFTNYDSEGNPTYPTKGMYSVATEDNIYARWDNLEYTCPYLWKVTSKGDKLYEIVNMATDATFDEVETSTDVTMTVGGENLMVFDAGISDAAGFLTIRVSTQPEGGYYYLHCESHSSGAGTSGDIVGWINTAAASSWNLIPVDDETAEAIIEAYAPVKDSQSRYLNAQTIIKDAQEKMGLTGNVSVSTTKLITSVDQLSSPYTEPSEGSLEALLDEDASTFWHSNWSDGSCDPGIHYLQVDLLSAVDEFVFTFTRRNADNDHITEWGVYGAPSDEAEKSECTFLAEIFTPYTSNTETLTSSEIASKGFTKLRFYFEATDGANYQNRGYAHMSEFQLYEAIEKENSQKAMLGDIYTNLEDIIAVAIAEGEDISVDTYNALKEAYDAFIEAFVDPTDLRSALELANSTVAGMVIGSNPGEWTDNSSAGTLTTTIAEATAYNDACIYTQEQSDAYVAALEEQMANVMDAAVKVTTDKWYELRYPTLDEVEENGWSVSNGAENGTNEGLFGKYVVVADWHTDDAGINYVDPLSEGDLYKILIGHNLFFDDASDILFDDYAKFRFINVGDTAYMMQNKATGLFLKAAGTSGYVTLSIHPSLFTVAPIGFGKNLVSAWSLDGDTQSNLHAQLSYNGLVTWPSSDVNSNSGLYIEDISEDVASDYDGTSFNMSIVEGAINTYCYPVSVTATEGTIYGVYVNDTVITLAPVLDNTAEPGQPFAYISGSVDDYDAEVTDADYIEFIHGYDLNKEAQTVGKLIGTYSSVTIGAGKIIASGNTFAVSSGYTASVPANGAYVNGDYDITVTIIVEFDEETFDSVESAIAAVAQNGNIYSIDGKFLGKGNVNTVKAFGRGIYIVNGVKVAVK